MYLFTPIFGIFALVVLKTPQSLVKVESMLGIEGKKIKVPAFFGRPSVDLPLLYLIAVGLLVYFGGPKAVLPILALAYFVTTSGPPARN